MINGQNAQLQRVQNLFHSVGLNVNNPHFLIMQGRITKASGRGGGGCGRVRSGGLRTCAAATTRHVVCVCAGATLPMLARVLTMDGGGKGRQSRAVLGAGPAGTIGAARATAALVKASNTFSLAIPCSHASLLLSPHHSGAQHEAS
jgi:hypothetical protein